MAKEFKLSSVLFGHSLDVRCVSVSSDNSILSGSRDKTAKLWRPNGVNIDYSEVLTYRDQKNFVICVLFLEATTEFSNGLVVTGGNDNTAYVYKANEPFATFSLKEHTNAVSCLASALQPNSFFTGSWDSTAKYWCLSKSKSSVITFSGHTAAIWSVLQMQNTNLLTASADKTVGIWTMSGQRINVIKGHTDCIRGLLDFPEMQRFLSISNDATIKVWGYSGELFDTYYGHTNYIYSIARCKSDEFSFVTSDEDRTVRYWKNGKNVQTFQLPAQSVWSVACLSNGDIVTGSSDGVIRIFTQNEQKIAEDGLLAKFNEEVEALAKQSMQQIGGYKVSDLPGKEALYDPGKKAGQMKIIREGTGVVAYTWVEEDNNSYWEKVGDVLGGTDNDSQNKTVFDGKSYDFVFSVDVEDGKPPLKLPYNKGHDPYKVANEFLNRNMLPNSYLEQVVDFILKNSNENVTPVSNTYVDPFTGCSRYTPNSDGANQNSAGVSVDTFADGHSTAFKPKEQQNLKNNSYLAANLDPFTGNSSYVTQQNTNVKYFPQLNYKTFDIGDANVILNKLKEFNKKCGDNNENVDEKYLEEFMVICNGPPVNTNTFDVLFKLLEWPDDIVFPVLDVVRMAVRHEKNNQVISTINNGVFIQKLLCFLNGNCKFVNNIIVSLRTLCNLFVHEYGENLVHEHRFDLLENITSLTSLNKNGQIALSTFLLNLTIATLKKNDDLGVSVLSDVIPDILTKLNDPESIFRSYVALGTLLTISRKEQIMEIRTKIKSNVNFNGALQLHLMPGQGDLEQKKINCAKQVQNLIT